MSKRYRDQSPTSDAFPFRLLRQRRPPPPPALFPESNLSLESSNTFPYVFIPFHWQQATKSIATPPEQDASP